MRHEDDRLPELVLEPQELVLEAGPDDRVDRTERLVHQHQRRVRGKRTGEPDPLALAARELGREPAAVVLRVEADELEQLAHTLANAPARPAEQPRHRADVPLHGHVGEETDLLDDIADRAPQLGQVVLEDRGAVDADVAARERDQPVDELERGRLPAARRADEDADLARGDGEREVVDGSVLTTGINLRRLVEDELGGLGRHGATMDYGPGCGDDRRMAHALPTGTVTFVFTDVEGSTRLLHELGAEAYAKALAEHRRVVRDAFGARGGVEVDAQGDAFFFAFASAPAALEAAREVTGALADGQVRIRMGLHTGTPLLTEEGYVGTDVHKAARIAACGHGGQVLVSAATAGLVGGDGLRDLGEHRLKDLSAPERIFQEGEGEFPPLRSLYRTNLPVPATSFLGRERELIEVLALLEQTHLLTLTGPGGTGKTRLALQAAADASDRYPDGVFWVPLAALRDAGLVLQEAARAVGASDDLAELVADKRLLLLLDNFEHVIDAADDLATLQSTCPNLGLLVTSRELLALPGEQAYPVPALEPDEGRQLFLVRARAADPAFEPDDAVAELCARLDDLPLALELAAARVRVLSPAELLERLSGRLDLLKAGRGTDARQQTLRATIEWSHDLLDEQEKALFARLAVFRGGCTLQAAEAVCDADLDVLQSLVDKSLLRLRDDGRFWMLETIRDYALERLEASGEADDLRDRHAQHILAVAEAAEPELRRYTKVALDGLDAEHDNVRAALDRLEQAGRTEDALRLAGAVWGFWFARGHGQEGRSRLESALAADAAPTHARARALVGSTMLQFAEPAIAQPRAEEALRIFEAGGDAWGVADAHWALGGVASTRRDFAKARDLWELSRGEFLATGDRHRFAAVTRSAAWAYSELGDEVHALQLGEEYIAEAEAVGDERLLARGLASRAARSLADGRANDALADARRAYEIDRGLGFSVFIASDLVRLATILARQQRPDHAARLVARSDLIHDEIGLGRESWAQEERDDALALIRDQMDETSLARAWNEGQLLGSDEAVALTLGDVPTS
jgi:predicted ATPase/class 3 adenylate cyclase